MAEPILTSVRQAVWEAIETWPPISSEWKRRYKFEDLPGRLGGDPSPTLGDLPALAIYPDKPTTMWTLNASQEIRYPLRLTLWTREWDVRAGERYWEEIVKALYQNLDPSSGTAKRVLAFTPLVPTAVKLGDAKDGPTATRWEFTVEIAAGFWNPKSAT